MAETTARSGAPDGNGTRRDFLELVTLATLGVGAATIVWPLINQMSPSADVLALSSTEVDLAPIAVGMGVTVVWRGKPVFIRHRTEEEIKAAQEVDLASLRDPQPDAARVQKPEWLVVVGICTHLGCVPIGTQGNRGNYDGWFCPCHGSHYDTSGRARQGPAPTNLAVPQYAFLSDTSIEIG